MKAKDLTQWRKERRISQNKLAELLGTYSVTVNRWEKGARGIPFLLPLALEALEHRLRKEEGEGHGKDQEVN
jgi:transcriptional regulator with XRE-family HTH domain